MTDWWAHDWPHAAQLLGVSVCVCVCVCVCVLDTVTIHPADGLYLPLENPLHCCIVQL